MDRWCARLKHLLSQGDIHMAISRADSFEEAFGKIRGVILFAGVASTHPEQASTIIRKSGRSMCPISQASSSAWSICIFRVSLQYRLCNSLGNHRFYLWSVLDPSSSDAFAGMT
eukprot:Filipodium_phascolosomae@DN2297_c0_g1_i2.p1